MKKLSGFVVVLALLMVAGMAHAGERAGAFSISPYVGGFVYDDDQQPELRTNRVATGFRLGYDFTDHFGTELVGTFVRPEIRRTDRDFNDWIGHLDFLYNFAPRQVIDPYLVVGGGVQSLQYPKGVGVNEHTDGIFTAGAGLKFFVTEDVAVRIDGRHIFDFPENRETIHNWEYSAGVTFVFGGKKETVAAAAPPPPAPAPVQEVTPPPPTPPHVQYCMNLRLQFDVDKAVVRDQYTEDMKRVCEYMKKYPSTTAVINGYTDNVGDAQYNMELSQRRAQAVVDYMVTKCGIDRSRLSAKGYGMTRPIADNATEEGRQKNRRIEAVIDCVTIPEEAPPAETICMSMVIEFDTGKADIKPVYRDEIAKVADYMKKYPTTTAVIEGHTDNVGSEESNMRLSQRRAQSVVDYLVNNFGIERSRLSAVGYGSSRSIAYNSTPEGRAMNRRINAIIDCVVK